MLSMKEAIENYVEGCVGKVDCPAYKLFMKAILAGMMIAFGAAGSSVAAHDIVNVGIARLRSEERRVGKECRSRWSPYH